MQRSAITTSSSLGVFPVSVDSGKVILVDQRKLPEKLEYFDATAIDDMCFAIKHMVVRGAPSIGVAAALGLASEAKRLSNQKADKGLFLECLRQASDKLMGTRPTAVDLRNSLHLVLGKASASKQLDTEQLAQELFTYASGMIEEHLRVNQAIGEYGAALIGEGSAVMTHCNAGSLAACGWGTALGVIKSAALAGRKPVVYVCETRPLQQGARLTAWELMQDNIEPTLVTDSMAGHLMAQGKVNLVVTGADRIARNGDAANKIGTYSLAVLAQYHKVPFYIAAPLSTFDATIFDGKDIPIEERAAEEVTMCGGKQMSPDGVKVYNPAFDVTPAHLISAIICEKGILRPPYKESLDRLFKV